MRIKYSLLAASLWMASCGGGASDSAAPRAIQARIAEPASLSTLATDGRLVTFELSYLIDGVEGEMATETDLALNQDGTAYNGDIASLAPGKYVMRLKISQTWQEASNDTVTVAVFKQPIDIVVGESQIVFDVAPSDFSTDIDDDGDSVSNLAEIQGITSPFKADTDGDGVLDNLDVFPTISTLWGDGDKDGIGDQIDNCIEASNADQKDNDQDHKGDVCDPDDDNDGLTDVQEASLGTDSFKSDTDGDGINDGKDNCPLSANANQLDSDKDGSGDVCDADDDNDGILDNLDKCPFLASADQTDTNGDGMGDVCTNDDDGDGISDALDNCRTVINSNQADTDTDGLGNTCDTDDDNDGVLDLEENSPGVDNLITNSLLADSDGDGVSDKIDNCPLTNNPNQVSNGDQDGEGDACDCDPGDSTIASKSAVFVAITGNDANPGARNAPVKTIQKAIQIALDSGKSQVYVGAGTYDGNLTMASGVSVLGGFKVSFDGATCQKKLFDQGQEVNQTILTAQAGSTVTFDGITALTRLEGVSVQSSISSGNPTLVSISSISNGLSSSQNNIVIENSYLKAPSIASGSVTAVAISQASPVFVNDIIDAGNSQESTAIRLVNSPAPKFVSNTIRGGGSTATSSVLQSSGSVPALVNNILFTDAGNTQRIFYFNEASPSASILCQNNLIFGVQGASPDKPKLYQDLNPSVHIFANVSQLNNNIDGNTPGGAFDKNATLTSDGTDAGNLLTLIDLFQDAANGNWRLKAGAIALDQGLNPFDAVGIQVLKDHDNNNRPNGIARDLGAFERTP